MFRALSMVLVAVMLMAGSAYAEKIGVFNSQSIAMESEPSKAAQQRMQSMFGNEKNQLEKQANDLQKQGETLQAQQAALSAKAREEKQMDFMRKRRDFEDKSRNFARRVEVEENGIRQTIARFILEASAVVAEKRNLDLILDAATGSVMYADKALDITKDMQDEVNRQWKAAGSKFPTAPARKK